MEQTSIIAMVTWAQMSVLKLGVQLVNATGGHARGCGAGFYPKLDEYAL